MTNDTKTTVYGLIAAGGIALGDYIANLGPDGLDVKSPVFWIGLVVAASLGLKSYFTNKANTTTVEKTMKVEVTTPTP